MAERHSFWDEKVERFTQVQHESLIAIPINSAPLYATDSHDCYLRGGYEYTAGRSR